MSKRVSCTLTERQEESHSLCSRGRPALHVWEIIQLLYQSLWKPGIVPSEAAQVLSLFSRYSWWYRPSRYTYAQGSSLVVQRLGVGTFTAAAWVQFLVWEFNSQVVVLCGKLYIYNVYKLHSCFPLQCDKSSPKHCGLILLYSEIIFASQLWKLTGFSKGSLARFSFHCSKTVAGARAMSKSASFLVPASH